MLRRSSKLSEKTDVENFKKELYEFAVFAPKMDFLPTFRNFIKLMQIGLEPNTINKGKV